VANETYAAPFRPRRALNSPGVVFRPCGGVRTLVGLGISQSAGHRFVRPSVRLEIKVIEGGSEAFTGKLRRHSGQE
jgi:hypothetical protein